MQDALLTEQHDATARQGDDQTTIVWPTGEQLVPILLVAQEKVAPMADSLPWYDLKNSASLVRRLGADAGCATKFRRVFYGNITSAPFLLAS
jgi:hypothetical protein